MSKKSILFVDDEPNILSGIRRMLRSMRNDCDFHFAGGGAEALELMGTTAIDVVVSDMRMPGMDGADLLEKVQERHPQVIRIMLTGQADEESVIRTVSVVHQFLAKPCEPEKLKDVLGRASALSELMGNEHLKEVITSVGTLPSIPSVYAELQEILKSSDANPRDVAKVIEKDIAMTAKIMQLVNSSFFGLFQKVESPERAVMLLGLDTVKILVLGVQIFSGMKNFPAEFSLETLWNHSMIVAQCSKKIASSVSDDIDLINNTFIAGMVHDIGRLILIDKMSESYLPLIQRAQEDGISLNNLEREAYSTTHCEIGAYLVGLWGFTGDVVEAIGFHNDLSNYPIARFNPAMAVHIADYFYHAHVNSNLNGTPPMLATTYIEKLGMENMMEKWEDICKQVIEESTNDDG